MNNKYSNHLLALAAGINSTSMEARFLEWQFEEKGMAEKYISAQYERSVQEKDEDNIIYWAEVQKKWNSIQDLKTDEYRSLVSLLTYVDSFEPRDKWIVPILKGNEFKDFRNQLLIAVEDYNSN